MLLVAFYSSTRGAKGGSVLVPPSHPPQPLRGCFPTKHRHPLTTISPAPGPDGRGGEGAATGLSPGQWAAGPQHLGLPAHHGRLLPRAAQPSPAARHARLHPPLLQVLPLWALRWGPEGAVSCFSGVFFGVLKCWAEAFVYQQLLLPWGFVTTELVSSIVASIRYTCTENKYPCSCCWVICCLQGLPEAISGFSGSNWTSVQLWN